MSLLVIHQLGGEPFCLASSVASCTSVNCGWSSKNAAFHHTVMRFFIKDSRWESEEIHTLTWFSRVFKGFQGFSSLIHSEICFSMFLPRHGFHPTVPLAAARLLLGQSPVEPRRTHCLATRGRRNPAKHEPT